jgi:acyl-coenzyme A synthetase/AMP-(fatty) acid ligase
MNLTWDNLSDAIFQYAEERPSALAVVEGSDRLTYRELAALIGKAAVQLHGDGVKEGEFVGVSLPMNIDHVIISLALLRIGAVPVDAPLQRPATPDIFEQFKIKRAFTCPEGPLLAVKQAQMIDKKWRKNLPRRTGDYRYAGSLDETIHFGLTSGSTGAPKGIITSQRQWIARFHTALKLFPTLLAPERPPVTSWRPIMWTRSSQSLPRLLQRSSGFPRS